ncbi:hypothetical protein PMIN06_010196 [Paraphaeosphaeria minitans]
MAHVAPITPVNPVPPETTIAHSTEIIPLAWSSSRPTNSTQAADPVQSPRPSDTNLAQDFMPVSVIETKEVTKKRKHNADEADTDKQPAAMQRRTCSHAPSPYGFVELGPDGDDEGDVVIRQRNKVTTASKARVSEASVEEPTSYSNSLDLEVNRMIELEEKCKAAAENGNGFVRNLKLRRSLADVTAASDKRRPILVRPTKVEMCLSNYPDIHIETDERERPFKAHITKMAHDVLKIASEAAIDREKEKRKLDAKVGC